MRGRHIDLAVDVVGLLEQELLRAHGEAEVCGLLGGFVRETGATVATVVHPLANLSLRKDSFAVDVEEFCQERDAIEATGLMSVALYHSHPRGSTRPSFRDKKIPWITNLASLIIAWDGEKLLYEAYGEVDGRSVPIAVAPYCDQEALTARDSTRIDVHNGDLGIDETYSTGPRADTGCMLTG